MDVKLELVLVPVSDVDRAKAFYTDKCGFDLLVDTPVGEDIRIVQVTPPGSACSIGFGVGVQDGVWHAGRHPKRASYMSFAEFSDPDGNLWVVQEVHRDDDE